MMICKDLAKQFMLCAVCLCMPFATYHQVLAQPSSATPIRTEMFLEKNTISLGEPVILNYKVSNLGTRPLVVRLGLYRTAWYTIALTNKVGQEVPQAVDQRLDYSQGFHIPPYQRLAPGGSEQDGIVVTQHFVITRPGSYVLSVHSRLPFVQDAGAGNEETLLQTIGTTSEQDFTFPLTVTATDPARSRATAQALQREVLQAAGHREAGEGAISALFSMPEAQAAATWQAVAADPGLDLWSRRQVAEQLARIATPKAVDILADMYWYPAQRLFTGFPGLDYPVSIPYLLRQIYNTAAPPLKKQIEALFAEHGEALP